MPLADLGPETLARLAVTTTPDYIVVLDSSLRYSYVNQVAKGLTMDQVIGARVTSFLPPEDRERVEGILQGVLDTGTSAVYEAAFTPPNDRVQYYESRVSPLQTAEGAGLVIVTTNISARKTELFDLEHFFNLTEDLMAILDKDGCFLRVNRAFESCMGYRAAELFGRSQLELIHPDDAERVLAAYAAAPTTPTTFRARTASGSEVLIELKVTGAEGQRSIAVGRDVTHARAMERQLLDAQKMDVVGHLAGGVAHDFNNLLTSILLNTELARQMLPEDRPEQDMLADVAQAGRMATDLAKRLSALSRNSRSKPGPVNLNRRIRALVESLRRTSPAHTQVHCGLEEHLPLVDGDAAQLEQVLLNLSQNAQEAMPEGGTLRINTQSLTLAQMDPEHPGLPPGGHVLIEISDTGRGIPEALNTRVFEPFFTTKENSTGAGLGLTIAQEIIAQHSGLLRLDAQAQGGTRARIYLPMLRAQEQPAETSRARPEQDHILLAEDQPLVRAVVERTLRQRGYRVTSAQNGVEALALIEGGVRFDLLLLDVVMPEMGGAELARLLLARPQCPPIVFASGYTQGTLASEEFRDIPMLQKPFDFQLLLDTLRERLDGAG